MRPRLVTVFLLLVLAPLCAVAWLGIRTAADERERLSRRFEELVEGRLSDLAKSVSDVVAARERELERITQFESLDAPAIRERVRTERLVSQIFVLDRDGELVHPPLDASRNAAEEAFLERTEGLWRSKEPFARPADEGRTTGKGASEEASHGWYTWYWGQGADFIYWRRDAEGRIIGAQIDRLLLMSDIVGELPETGTAGGADRIQLVGADGETIYEWGSHEPEPGVAPSATVALAAPLGAWRLRCFCAGDAPSGAEAGVVATTAAGIGVLALVVVALAIYFFRETGRDAREARQRVSFVNQVSHELKTPLTNIRMYAELLDEEIDEGEERRRRYLQVIVSESQRLSRLIGNVLSFARRQREKLVVRPTPGRIDEVVRAVVDQFMPSLLAARFQVDLALDDDGISLFDGDAVGQIVGNLLSNAEKYASSGKWIGVASARTGDRIEITVSDRGPGISPSQANRVFEPFVRLSTKVEEGVSGTGIGLSIARDLARLHGGDLSLESGHAGAVFKVAITAPRGNGGDE